ncbi:hypothetical protein [Gemmobacter denitrificans]|uniref:Alpha/beta hydrolase n=1 Tax=Gemmobacter denitrificans TaxID=3123040 RepID=A0ABU8BR21_9RHOB
MRIIAATRDATFPPDLLRNKVTTLGHPNAFLVIPDHTHWLHDAGPQIAEQAWVWMAQLSSGTGALDRQGCVMALFRAAKEP